MNINKNLVARYINAFFAILLGLIIFGIVAPSLIPNEHAIKLGIEPSPVNPKLIWGCAIFTPVVFCIQQRYRWLKNLGWVILCLMLALSVV